MSEVPEVLRVCPECGPAGLDETCEECGAATSPMSCHRCGHLIYRGQARYTAGEGKDRYSHYDCYKRENEKLIGDLKAAGPIGERLAKLLRGL